jgi:hypothetical protein
VPSQPPLRRSGLVLRSGDATVPGIVLADSYWRRLRGMLARRELPAGLLLVPGGSVHGVGMTRSLDVAVLGPAHEGADRVRGPHRVLRTGVLRPMGLHGSAPGARAVLEAPVGSLARWGLAVGDVVSFAAPGDVAGDQSAGDQVGGDQAAGDQVGGDQAAGDQVGGDQQAQ